MEKNEQESAESAPKGMIEGRKRVLDEQKLVNEREHLPGESGGMATPPVEKDEPPARPEVGRETSRDALEPQTPRPRDQGDIERQGA